MNGNNLQTKGTIKIARGLENTSTLIVFSISNNCITDKAANIVAVVLSKNSKLQKLYLAENSFQGKGGIETARALKDHLVLDISNSRIDCCGLNEICVVLSS